VNALYQERRGDSGSSYVPVATAPSGSALILTYLHVDTFYDPSPGSGQYVTFYVRNWHVLHW